MRTIFLPIFWEDLKEESQQKIMDKVSKKLGINDLEELDNLINRTFDAEARIGDEEV